MCWTPEQRNVNECLFPKTPSLQRDKETRENSILKIISKNEPFFSFSCELFFFVSLACGFYIYTYISDCTGWAERESECVCVCGREREKQAKSQPFFCFCRCCFVDVVQQSNNCGGSKQQMKKKKKKNNKCRYTRRNKIKTNKNSLCFD